MKVKSLLVSAYGCEPRKGSEQGVGWNWMLQLARVAELVVVTRANNRSAIAAALPADLEGRVRFVYYDIPAHFGSFKRGERGLYLYYLLWQWGAYQAARRELVRHPVDYAMHLTFGSVWMPTFMHRLPVPFIWGPVGGGEAVPWSLIHTLPLRARFVQYARYALMATFGLNPLMAGIARKARVILVRTDDTARIFSKRHVKKIRVVLETAATTEWFVRSSHATQPAENCKTVRVVYTGRLVAFKNLAMMIRAVARARALGADIHFTIVGDGPLEESLHNLAVQCDIIDSVTFRGRVTQDEVIDELAASDVYLFLSLREGGPWSLMEAMATELPVICLDTSGMSVIADDTCAMLIEPTSASEIVERAAAALCELAVDADLRRTMGANARLRLQQHFTWNQKGKFMSGLLKDLENGVL